MRSRLAWKVGSWLTLVFVAIVYVGWQMVLDFNKLHQKARIIETANRESHRLHELETGLMNTVTPVRSFLISGDWRLPKTFKNRRASIFKSLNENGSGQLLINPIILALDEITSRANQVFSLPFPVGNLEGPILMREIDDIMDRASQRLSVRHHELDQSVNTAMRMVSDMRMNMRNNFLLSIIFLFLLLAGLAIYLSLHMVRPLVNLRHEMKKISYGDFDIHCPDLPKDELGELALACNSMGKALQTRELMLNQARNMAAHHEKMQALGLMAAGIAHEVGNPLAGASVSLETALRKLKSGQGGAAEERLQVALDELSRMEAIIRNILDYGMEGNESGLAGIDIEPIAQSAIALARMSPRRRHVVFKSTFKASRMRVTANSALLRQVLVNLLLNAMDACGNDGLVELSAEPFNNGLALNICDNGPGIPPELHEKIFTPLFTTKKGQSGTGLGLAISSELMQRMHGRLELVRSDHNGSHFRAWLPFENIP